VCLQVGVPDILVNCAGCWYIQEFAHTDYDSWDEMIDTNIKGYLNIIGRNAFIF
jgi:NADP-dependent 3-hydroxy acid dehydrogenase YdfG